LKKDIKGYYNNNGQSLSLIRVTCYELKILNFNLLPKTLQSQCECITTTISITMSMTITIPIIECNNLQVK